MTQATTAVAVVTTMALVADTTFCIQRPFCENNIGDSPKA